VAPSIEDLRNVCGKTKKSDPWREKVARKISIRLTKFLLLLFPRITPNQVTVIMIIFGISSAFFFMNGGYIYGLIGILLYHAYLILDACDGEIARYKKMFSKKGLYLDYMGHIIINPLIVLSIGIGAFFNNPFPIPDATFLIIGFIGMFSMTINNFVKLKKYEMYIDGKEFKLLEKMQKGFKAQDRRKNPIKDELWQFFRIMTFNGIFFFGILHLMPLLSILWGVIFPVQAILRFRSEIKKEI